MTRRVAYGAALSVAVGIGLGVWLAPPPPHYGSTGATVVTPPRQPDLWAADVSSTSSVPDSQPASAPAVVQTAAVSPPSADAPTNWTATPTAQPAVRTSTATQSGDQAGDAYAQHGPVRVAYNSRPQPAPAAGRDWADEDDASPPGGRDAFDDGDAPPPPRWQPPPPRPRWAPPPEPRPSMQDRRWDFRPDGSAVPLDDGDDGD